MYLEFIGVTREDKLFDEYYGMQVELLCNTSKCHQYEENKA